MSKRDVVPDYAATDTVVEEIALLAADLGDALRECVRWVGHDDHGEAAELLGRTYDILARLDEWGNP